MGVTPSAISISRRQWSLEPHSSTEFMARTVMPSWNPRGGGRRRSRAGCCLPSLGSYLGGST